MPTSVATRPDLRFNDFAPRRWLRNPHLQTIAGNYLPRIDTLPPAATEYIEVSIATSGQDSSQVLCHCHWQPAPALCPTAILLHGLEGSSASQYILGNANKLWHAGCNIVRMNMRNCGGTENLSPTLYHSGLSGDVLAVMNKCISRHALQSISLLGYSMGGNIVLKLAGELGSSAPPQLRSVIGVSPAIDLAPSADALHTPANRIYEEKFLRALKRRFRRKARLFPHVYDAGLAMTVRSLRDFDHRITALYSGFASADDYYHRASAARVLHRIAVPTLILHSLDDPFVRLTRETRSLLAENPDILFFETQHGGHCAFLAQPSLPANDGYWAEYAALQFLLAHA